MTDKFVMKGEAEHRVDNGKFCYPDKETKEIH